MAVVVTSDLGWFVDHQLSIDDTYKCTAENRRKGDIPTEQRELVQQRGEIAESTNERDMTNYRCNPDLFAIWQPFVMDSYFNRALERQDTVFYVNGKTKEKDADSYSVERSETSAKTESSLSAACQASYERNSENVPAVILSSMDIPPSMQQKIGTSCYNRKRKRRKQPLNVGELASLEEHLKISQLLSTALRQLRSLLIDSGYDATVAVYDNNVSARHAASAGGVGDLFVQRCQQAANLSFQSDELIEIKSIDCLTPDEDLCNQLIEQPHETAVTETLMGSRFILPPQCRFLLSDISCLEPLLTDETQYDCIVIDPPWENKSVKRKKTYTTLADWDFLQLPIRKLCGGATLVLVWVTNKQRQQNFVREYLFPKWNVKYLTKWYWLKVTKLLEPVYDLTAVGPSKRPYECILLGSTSSSSFVKMPQNRVIMSVPCSIHSRKPPLNEILRSYLPPNAKCLEMFARSLLPNWTSWGNEVLEFQHLDFFENSPHHTSSAERVSVSAAYCDQQNSSF